MKSSFSLTVSLSVITCLLMLLPGEIQALGYFDYDKVVNGEYWRLITGHWLHGDSEHLWWNVGGLAILAAMIEWRSRSLLVASLFVGMLSIDILLLSPFSSIQFYIGLSGMLNTLLVVALAIYWQATRSPIVIVVGLLCIAKIVIEIASGHAVFTDTSWPSYAVAHLAGFLGAAAVLISYLNFFSKSSL